MTFNLLHVCLLFSLALVGSHAVSPQAYWNAMLPKTPMPKAIKDLLDTKGWDDGVAKVTANTISTYIKLKDQPEQSYSYDASKDEVKDPQPNIFFYVYGASNDMVKDPQPRPTHQPKQSYSYDAPKDEVKDPQPNLFFIAWNAANDMVKDLQPKLKDQPKQSYSYDVSKDEVKDPQPMGASNDEVKEHAAKEKVKNNPFDHLLFLENDLHKGKEMELQFNINNRKATFLPKNMADSIPFSSNDLSKIYNLLSVNPDSVEAKIIKRALITCDLKGSEGEEKFCATSLESMIDFITAKLGKNVKALSTENSKESTVSQKYTIELVKKLGANNAVICHRHTYPYAVFYCHALRGTQAYVVYLEGANGTKVKATAVCHTDTSKWHPHNFAFKVLKVAPGTVPVCHFLLEDTVLWVPSK